jgi:hypothetical protein
MLQRELFPRLYAEPVSITPAERKLLDVLVLLDGKALPKLRSQQREILRNTMRKGFVRWVGPSYYAVTPRGMFARTKGRERREASHEVQRGAQGDSGLRPD